MTDLPLHIDEYLNDRTDAPHLSPKLIIEKTLCPNLTVWVSTDGKGGKFQRWYDVTPEVLDGVGVRSRDFFPDSIVRLVDKDGYEIHHIQAKLTDEFDGLPFLLARIEKAWSAAQSASDFWSHTCDLLIRSKVPSLEEVSPNYPIVCRGNWLELSCFWIAFLAKVRHEAGQPGWGELLSGDQLLSKYIDVYNESPARGLELREPSYQIDRVRLQRLLDAARKAKTNYEKKETLEALAEYLLKGVKGFEVLSNQISATGEIDRVVRNSTTSPMLTRFGPLILIECKHWTKTVGTDEVGTFISDLRDAGVTSGFLFCRRIVAPPAEQRSKNFYQRDKGFILAVTEADIQSVCDGANFAHLLVEKAEDIIFQRARRRPQRKTKKNLEHP